MAKRAKAKPAARGKGKPKGGGKGASGGFSTLERNILASKGLSAAQIAALVKSGVRSKADFATVGDADTLAGLVKGCTRETAAALLAWAKSGGGGGNAVVIESPDITTCVHCGTRQPKDWKSGDLCVHCGKEAEPVHSCFWCNGTGPGKFCRRCGTVFVPDAETELAAQLKREGVAKDDIPVRLAGMSAAEKDALRARAARFR